MLHANNSTESLCRIMDWGMPNWGWLLAAVDYGQFDALGFSLLFERELSAMVGVGLSAFEAPNWWESLPKFGARENALGCPQKEASTLGEWVLLAAPVISRELADVLAEIWKAADQ